MRAGFIAENWRKKTVAIWEMQKRVEVKMWFGRERVGQKILYVRGKLRRQDEYLEDEFFCRKNREKKT